MKAPCNLEIISGTGDAAAIVFDEYTRQCSVFAQLPCAQPKNLIIKQ